VQISDSVKARTDGLAQLAADYGFETLAVYLWERSGVDEPAADDVADTRDTEAISAPRRVRDVVPDTDTADKQKKTRKTTTRGGFTVLEEEEEDSVRSKASAEEQRSDSASETGRSQSTGDRVDEEPAEGKRDTGVAEEGLAKETSGAKLSGEDGVPSVPSADKEQSSTAPLSSNLEPTGSHAEVEPAEQKRDSGTAEKGPAEQMSGAKLSGEEGVQTVPTTDKEQSSTAPQTGNMEPTRSQTEVESTEAKRDSSTAEKVPTEQTGDEDSGSQQASGHQVEASKALAEPTAGDGSLTDAEEKKSGEELRSSNKELTDNSNEENAN